MNNTDTSSADCQFVKVPLHLFCRLDNNLRSMLFTLIQLSTYYAEEDGWFFRGCEDLQKQSNLSENLVRATLDGLYMKGLIDVRCEGKGKGRNTHPNFFKVNFERFKDYEKDDIEKCFKDPRLVINTPKYKGSHYHPSYLDKSDRAVVTETVVVKDAVNDKVDDEVNNVVEKLVKSEDNINNIDNKNNICNNNIFNNSNNIIYNKENTLLNIDYYFNSGLQSYEGLKIKSLLAEKINSISEIKNIKELLQSMLDVNRFITNNQHMFISSKVESLRGKVEELLGAKRRELEQINKT